MRAHGPAPDLERDESACLRRDARHAGCWDRPGTGHKGGRHRDRLPVQAVNRHRLGVETPAQHDHRLGLDQVKVGTGYLWGLDRLGTVKVWIVHFRGLWRRRHLSERRQGAAQAVLDPSPRIGMRPSIEHHQLVLMLPAERCRNITTVVFLHL